MMKITALEEHFVTPELVEAWGALDPKWQDVSIKSSQGGATADALIDLGQARLAAMDAAEIDVQVISVTAPGLQNLSPEIATSLQQDVNDTLARAIKAQPDRFQGLATLATAAPDAAARELERAVTTLGFTGAMLFGRTRERNMEHRDFWPIYEAAAALNAPLYLHPQSSVPAVRAALYDGFADAVSSAFATHGIGWYYETGIQLVRMMMSGVFDRFPNLQVVVGHWGELVLFYLDKLDLFGSEIKLKRSFSEYVRDNVYVTPSGLFSQRYLDWMLAVVGADRVMMSTDYPYVAVPPGGARRFLEDAGLQNEDRAAIASGNWNRLRAGIRR